MNRLALGTAQFGLSYGIANQNGQVSLNEAKNMIGFSIENGINTLDTAKAYGNSEFLLGQIGVHGLNVVTKLPPIPPNCKNISAWTFDHIADSLEKLKSNQIYGLLLHHPSDLINDATGNQLYDALMELKNKKLVRKIGVSIYDPDELDRIMPLYEIDMVQAPFSIFDQRLAGSGWLKQLHKKNIELHVRSVFLQGMLLMHEKDIPVKFKKWKASFEQWNKWLGNNEISALEGALGFVLSFPEISKVIVGAESVSQLSEITRAAHGRLISSFPTIICDNEFLLNPSKWSRL